jgi:hypothetical protein
MVFEENRDMVVALMETSLNLVFLVGTSLARLEFKFQKSVAEYCFSVSVNKCKSSY